MPLTLAVRLRDGNYDAAAGDARLGEWPPHPARLFCALVASAADDADLDALRWLESAGQPHVLASPSKDAPAVLANGFVVTNAVERGGGSLTWPGRTNKFRSRAAVRPRDGAFAVVWPDADPDDPTLGRLVRLANRVPYVGRSTATAEVTVSVAGPELRDGWTEFAPVPYGEPSNGEWRLPYAGYVDDLRNAYESGRRAWEVDRSAPFREGATAAPPEPAATSPYELLVWGFSRPVVAPDGRALLEYTSALRRAVLARVADPVPPMVSGHGADGLPHVAFLGLVDVGHDHADGRLLGLAVALPRALTGEDRTRVLRSLLDQAAPFTRLDVGRSRLRLERDIDSPRRAQRLERWTRGPDGTDTWATATPLMLDRYVKRDADIEVAVADALVTAGHPRPDEVAVSPSAFVHGGVTKVHWGHAVHGRPRRPTVHVRVRFPAPVVGPVLAGSMRYLGLGLFVPQRGRS
ncbi:MAG: CRISPR-associated protein Csb2 [Frankiaceae bacterium]|jgi:CRISPR-associated protein Csb2|nr:CRISPR-associated protein Csb2 [Frankiaceae bacterium]